MAWKKAVVIAVVEDFCGDEYEVKRFAETKFGWTIAVGWPANRKRGRGGAGGAGVILTQELVDRMEEVKQNLRPMSTVDLPLTRHQIKRLRRLLGHDRKSDRREWWIDHSKELHEIPHTEFGRKYEVSPSAAEAMFADLFGHKRGRDSHWWMEEDFQKILGDDGLTTVEKADRLGRSVAAVCNARYLLGITRTYERKAESNE